MNALRLGIWTALIFLLNSCLKEEPYKPSADFTPSLIVHAYISSDSQTMAWVSESSSILSKIAPVNNAGLSIKTKTSPIQNFASSTDGRYTLINNSIKPGDSFTFSCNHPLASFAISVMRPHLPSIASIDTQTRLNPFVGGTLNFDLRIKDSAAIENYYRLYVEKTVVEYIYDYQNILIDSQIVVDRIPIFGKEIAFIQNDYNKYNSEEILFTDATFNGVLEDFSFYTSDILIKTLKDRPLKVTVKVENLSRALYEFYNNRNAHIWQQKSIIQVPGSVSGNINNVIGIVGSSSSFQRTFRLP